jgi:lipoprotein-releasing system permease protein
MNFAQANQLMGYDLLQAQSIRLKITDVFNARVLARDVAYNFDHYVYINDWTRTQGHLFKDIQLVRMVMFIVLVLVIAVASFNIVSTLIMAVNEKQGDIAILRTMGASSPVIMFSFIVQGLVNGVLGCFVGALFGVYLALNLTDIISSIERFFDVNFLSGDVYFINYLPSYLHLSDVYITVVTALLMSFLATLYPAWRATKIEPAQVLGQL